MLLDAADGLLASARCPPTQGAHVKVAQKTRKLTKSEKDELAGIVSWPAHLGRTVLFLLAVAFAGAVSRGLFDLVNIDSPIWVVPTLVLAYLLFRRSARWTGGRALRRLVRRDLEQNEARVTEIYPVEVIEIEELEDEGPSYIIKTKDGEWILLSGQEMEPYKRRGFPWSRFSADEAPNSGIFFGLTKSGEPIPPDRTIAPLSYELARDLGTFNRTLVVLEDKERALVNTAIAKSAPLE